MRRARTSAHLSVLVNGAVVATTASSAAEDTRFAFGPIGVRQGESLPLRIEFSATYGTSITLYTAGNPGGTFTASNACANGAPRSSTTAGTGLRAVISGPS